jgi:hypothetical protein
MRSDAESSGFQDSPSENGSAGVMGDDREVLLHRVRPQCYAVFRTCKRNVNSEKGVRGQGSGVRGQGSGVRGQGSGVRGQGSGVRGQGSGVRGQGSGSLFQRSRQSKNSRCRFFLPLIPDPCSLFPDPSQKRSPRPTRRPNGGVHSGRLRLRLTAIRSRRRNTPLRSPRFRRNQIRARRFRRRPCRNRRGSCPSALPSNWSGPSDRARP